MVFGERLRLARKMAGLSLRDLSDEIGGVVSAQAIGKYERDEMMPNSTVLIELCRVLNVGMDFFAAPTGARLTQVDFRKHSGTKAQERAQVEASVIEHVERYLLIEEVLQLDSAEWHTPFNRRKISCVEDAEKIASLVRDEWKLGNDPILNLTELLEEKGIKVMMLPLPGTVSGLTCVVERDRTAPVPVVVVNSTHNLERRRMTLAHELGHRLFTAPSKIEEKAATRFAGALLMPMDHLFSEVGKRRHSFGVEELMAVKRIYRVSAAALIVRLRDIGIITNDKLTTVFRTVGRKWRSSEPRPIEVGDNLGQYEKPKRFERLCYRALAEDLVSVTKVAELLNEPVQRVVTAMTEGLSNGEDRHQ